MSSIASPFDTQVRNLMDVMIILLFLFLETIQYLFQNIQNTQALVYWVNSHNHFFSDPSIIYSTGTTHFVFLAFVVFFNYSRLYRSAINLSQNLLWGLIFQPPQLSMSHWY